MKTKEIQTWLPVFSGFYGTIWEPSEDYEMEAVNSERKAKGLPDADFDSFQFDYDDYKDRVIKGIASELEKELELFVKAIKIERLVSPREYNFANDSANVTVTLCAANEKRIMKYLDDHKAEFETYLERYKSRSGFISSYPYDREAFLSDKPLEHAHKLGSILDFIAHNEDEEIEMTIYDRVVGDISLSCLNYDELVSAPDPIEVTDIKEQVKGLINTYLSDHNDEVFISALDELNEQKIDELGGEDKAIWFRFPSDSTLATTIRNVRTNLAGQGGRRNEEHLIECLELSKDGDFKILYS